VSFAGDPDDPGFGALVTTLVRPGQAADGDGFGAALGLGEGGIYVGAPGVLPAGAVHLFETPTDEFPLTLVPPDAGTVDGFGSAIAASGGALIVGAPSGPTGAAFAYPFGPERPPLRLDPPADAPARFGASVAVLDDYFAVGAPGLPNEAGAVVLYARPGGAWVATITAPEPAAGDQMGAALATTAGELFAGSPGAGIVHRFAPNTSHRCSYDSEPSHPADRFGASLAITARGLLVGAPGDAGFSRRGGAAFLFTIGASTCGEQVSELRPRTPRQGAGFGTAVAAVGARLIVGAPGDATNPAQLGATYLFGPTAMLDAVVRKQFARAEFGTSVALDGETLYVGAPFDPEHGGSVYRVALADQTPQPLENPGSTLFGFAVTAKDGIVAVGAPGAGVSAGDLHLYEDTQLRATLRAADGFPGDQLGFALALDGGEVFGGAPLAGPLDTGFLAVFDAATALERLRLEKPTPVTGDFLGAAVAADATTVLVGAPFDDDAFVDAGAAYVFDRASAALLHTLVAPDAAPDALFGATVALTPAFYVVGAPYADDESGTIHLFDRATGLPVRSFPSPHGRPGDRFGATLAALDDDLLVGAPYEDGDTLDTGAVYLLDTAAAGRGEPIDEAAGTAVRIRNPLQGEFDRFGTSVSLAAERLAIGAPGASQVYVFGRRLDGMGSAQVGTLARASHDSLARTAEAVGSTCGNGVLEGSEACDDGNTADGDDCSADCSERECCALPSATPCNDRNPCTTDFVDPERGCVSVPNDLCCSPDDDTCGENTCRACVGCALFPWDCCGRGSQCLTRLPQCVGTECVAAATCECAGGLACDGQDVPADVQALFVDGCDALRVGESLVAGASTGSDFKTTFKLTRKQTTSARKTLTQTTRMTRKLKRRGELTAECRESIQTRVKSVRRAIPKRKQLRRCLRQP